MNFVSMHQPHVPGGHIHTTHLHPNGSPIVNSQVTDMHPDGSVSVSQSSKHHYHPTGTSGRWPGRPHANSHESNVPFPPHRGPGSFNHLSHGINFDPGRRPIVNSQVTDMHPDGSVSISQSTNHPSGGAESDHPSINSHEQLNAPFKPLPSRPNLSGTKPIVNSQVTNLHPDGDKPIINSQVTEF